MFDYHKNTVEAFSLFKKLFQESENDSFTVLEKKFKTLENKHPQFYLYTQNNYNFLFLKDFNYSRALLNFLSTKYDLNFLEGNKQQSPALFHLIQFLYTDHGNKKVAEHLKNYLKQHTISSLDAENLESLSVGRDNDVYLILKTDSPAVVKFKLDYLKANLQNFKAFSEHEQSIVCYKDEYRWNNKPNRHIIGLILNRIASHVNSQYYCVKSDTIDWPQTIEKIFENTFELSKYKSHEWRYSCDSSVDSQESPSTALLFLSLRFNKTAQGLSDTETLWTYLGQRLNTPHQQIDWTLPIDGTPLIYRLAQQIFMPPQDLSDPKAWKIFMDKAVYQSILPQFSFKEIFSNHHKKQSLYDMMEHHWIPNLEQHTGLVSRKYAVEYMRELITKGPAFEEKIHIERQVSFKTTSNKKLKTSLKKI